MALCMAGTFGGLSGHGRPTGSEPCPAQIYVPEQPYLPGGQEGFQTSRLEQPSIPIVYLNGSMMKIIVDARAVNV